MHARMHVIRQYFFAQSSEVLESCIAFLLMLVVQAHVVYSNSLWQVLFTIMMACGWPGLFWNDRYYYGALLQPSMDHNTRPYFTQLAIDYLLQQRRARLKYVFIAYADTNMWHCKGFGTSFLKKNRRQVKKEICQSGNLIISWKASK